MSQAIYTKYIGPTNFKGSRVKASCQAKSIMLDWNDDLNSDQNHQAAALALAIKLGWYGHWIGGGLESGNCYVNADWADRDQFTIHRTEDTEAAMARHCEADEPNR